MTQGDPPTSDSSDNGTDIIVHGRHVRGSAVGSIEPIAVLDENALKGLGVTTIKDVLARLKGIATSAAGGEPALLLNGRRVSGVEDLYSLPFEAIERTEILSEQDAARLGFPSTVRVMNFITKKHFRALSVQGTAGTTTEGGGGTHYAELNATRINDGRRLSLTGSYTHQDNILQSSRSILPDPAVPFALQGNVTRIGGGSIDPALDALAGRAVTIAAVPPDAQARRNLSSYAAAGQAITDIGPYRTLQPRTDQLRFDGTLAVPIKTIDLSFNLSAQQNWTAGSNGLAAAAITVPAGPPALPFTTPVLVNRYLPGIILRQQGQASTLHGGMTAQGGIGRWAWNASARYDRVVNRSASETGVPTDALQAAIAAGGDPLQPLGSAEAAQRLVQRSRTRTDTVATHGGVNGPLVRLPAGDALVTVTTDFSRSASALSSGGGQNADQPFARSITSASAAIDLPIASANQNVLAFAGQLGVNASAGVSAVSGYGRLANSTVGFDWTPTRPVQLSGSIIRTRTAPAINLLVDPLLTVPNVPVFDYVTGSSALVSTLNGGNPTLAPEQRRVSTLSVQLQPFRKKEFRLTLDLVNTRIEGQSASLGNVTAPFQAAFPALFSRDLQGNLFSVDLRPVNLARESERKLHWSLSGNAQIGPTPPAPPQSPLAAKAAPPPPPPPPRLNVYVFLSGNYRFSDRLELSGGQPVLDLLNGASLTGSGGRPRWDVDGTIGGSYGAVNAGIYSQLQGSTRIRSDVATSDLRFSSRTLLLYYTNIEIEKLWKQPWAKRLSLNFAIENLLDNRIAVRDRDSGTPNRFQGAYLDPAGRTVRLGVRKLF
ncbi:hypothetical protein [Sphingomonas sp. PAMC 26605]|uniref:hypothetical protein n=1 Tax=Sphingomonas sp. PAMC 26605 TaxID=1112214 RepID=UPI00026CCFE3|nr:hypothetical protein [Sphingomonas sp. PAMC 26605]